MDNMTTKVTLRLIIELLKGCKTIEEAIKKIEALMD